MNYYSHSNNLIRVCHFPGSTREVRKDLIQELKEVEIKKDDNFDIISIISSDTVESSCLNYQLNKNNISYINPILGKNIAWNNAKKIKYIADALRQSDKEYCLVVDGADVVFASDLVHMEDVLEYYNKDIIFNASIWMHPPVLVDDVENRAQYGEYNYLNAGCVFGKRESLISFYDECLAVYQKAVRRNENKENIWADSEQYYVRKVFDKHQDTVFFDYDCKMFQVWHKAEMEISNDGSSCYLK